MSDLALHDITTEAFSITPQYAAGVLTIKLDGTGDTAAVAALETFLESTGREIERVIPHAVVFDVRSLYLLNSSCLKAMLAFIFRLVSNNLPCSVRFVVDSKLGWQRRSLIALQRMAPDLVSIEDS